MHEIGRVTRPDNVGRVIRYRADNGFMCQAIYWEKQRSDRPTGDCIDFEVQCWNDKKPRHFALSVEDTLFFITCLSQAASWAVEDGQPISARDAKRREDR